jgi:monoterpene epsilon-lactone hydrolase
MVMADRPDVRTASAPIAAVDTFGLAQQVTNALVRVPFRSPWKGPSGLVYNLGQNVTREIVRTFMGYSSSLPIEEFRSIEHGLDILAKFALRPVVALEGVEQSTAEVGGVPGVWYRPKDTTPIGQIVYLHGGGYVGTSPNMYAFFTARLAAVTQCDVFVADYRLAPEFPYPAGLEDAVAVVSELLRGGTDPRTLFVAGDSGGGGLACSVVHHRRSRRLPHLGGALLFSPEIDLRLDQPSISDNADKDILPWNVPTAAYLHGEDAGSAAVSAVDADVSHWPPVFMTWGSDEMFRDSITTLSEHLHAAGVTAVTTEAPGMFHVYPILMPWADASRETYREIGEFVRERVTEAAEARAAQPARRTGARRPPRRAPRTVRDATVGNP